MSMAWEQNDEGWQADSTDWQQYMQLDWAQRVTECLCPLPIEVDQACGPLYRMFWEQL